MQYEEILKSLASSKIGSHRLLSDIRELSRKLAAERAGLRYAYLNEPAYLQAYLNYFLPWNIYRLALLLPDLPMNIQENTVITDLGSGPLTMLQALWLFRPELREQRLTFHCMDSSGKIMKKGLDIFNILSKGRSVWQIVLHEGDIGRLPATLRGKADLITALNVLNELKKEREENLQYYVKRHLKEFMRCLKSQGDVFLMEPGTRLGGRLISQARFVIETQGGQTASPCTHGEKCPILAEGCRSWCHFRHKLSWIPSRLGNLSEKSGLLKKEISLSFLYASIGDKTVRPEAKDFFYVRILSDPFQLPEKEGDYCYGCAFCGLLLVPAGYGREKLSPGQMVKCSAGQPVEIDKKSGAKLVKFYQT